LILTREGQEVALQPKADNVPLVRGDRVRLETSGGGGFGPPGARDPAALKHDVAMGYVTPARARAVYGVEA
jgi:N-methylhydantoinase B/oxoprolinase/acetone carboxylase alpha subunit